MMRCTVSLSSSKRTTTLTEKWLDRSEDYHSIKHDPTDQGHEDSVVSPPKVQGGISVPKDTSHHAKEEAVDLHTEGQTTIRDVLIVGGPVILKKNADHHAKYANQLSTHATAVRRNTEEKNINTMGMLPIKLKQQIT